MAVPARLSALLTIGRLATPMITALGIVLLAAGPVTAQDISGKGKEAETLAGQGKFIEAIAALDAATALVWEKSPLLFRRALWVSEEAGGYGNYTAREDNVFASGADMHVYAEPIGFGWRQSGDVWQTEHAVDVVVKSKDGAELLRQSDFSQVTVSSHAQNREVMLNLTYTLTGIAEGEYVIDTTVRDQVTGKSGMFSLPFVIR